MNDNVSTDLKKKKSEQTVWRRITFLVKSAQCALRRRSRARHTKTGARLKSPSSALPTAVPQSRVLTLQGVTS